MTKIEKNAAEKGKNFVWIFTLLVLIAGAVYIYFTFTAPPTESSKRLGLVGMTLFVIQFTFILPFIATWILGAVAAGNLKRYESSLTDPSIRKGYRYFAIGTIFLVLELVVAQLAGLPRNFFQENLSVIADLSILVNYIHVFFPLMGFIFFFRGAQQLSSKKAAKDTGLTSLIIVMLLGVIYSALIFTNSTRQVSLIADVRPTYFIPDILIVATIIIPTLIAWYFGFRAALIMGESQTTAAINQNGFPRLMNGIWLVVFSSIILQGLVSLGAERFLSFGLGITLGLIYLFLMTISVGYWLMASGSKNLLDQK